MKGIVEIKKVIQGGWGLAHYQGKTLFIPFTVGGDKVRFSSYKTKKNTLFCNLEDVIEPSPMRHDPECSSFTKCGGCHFLHISYKDEIEIKRRNLLETLRRIGKISTTITGVIKSPERFGYRNHAVFRVDSDGNSGFLERNSSNSVPFPKGGCPLLAPEIRKAIEELPQQSLPAGGKVRVRLDKFGAVNFWGLRDQPSAPDILMSAGGFIYPVNPCGFFQINRFLNDSLIDLVQSLTSGDERRILDLYCGCGFFTLPLSKTVPEITGIEIDVEAIENARAAAKLNHRDSVSFKKGAVGKSIKDFRRIDTIIADAPREGISRTAVKRILSLKPKRIILVSCDPSTFARDAACLTARYFNLSKLYMIDLFPGTYHTEMVALFNRKPGQS